MGKLEKEIKILDVNKEDIEKKLCNIGATKKEESLQKIYVYDLPTIYARFYDCLFLLEKCNKPNEYNVCRAKLEGVLNEIDNLTTEEIKLILEKETSNKYLVKLLKATKDKDLLTVFSKNNIVNIIKQYRINPNKWVRLRQTNETTTLTIKHILNEKDKETKIQKVMETEMKVPSINEGKDILKQLGFSFRNYQEKERTTYNFENAEIDIDTWPLIPTYIEIECDSEEMINNLITKLGLEDKKKISCNTAKVYELYGIDIYEYMELKF